MESSPPTEDSAAPQAAAPPKPTVRRGRGTFTQKLRSSELTKAPATQPSATQTSSTSAMVTLQLKRNSDSHEEEKALKNESFTSTTTANTTSTRHPQRQEWTATFVPAAAAQHEGSTETTYFGSTSQPVRANFGMRAGKDTQEAETVRQILFRGEKRRRYCIIVGDLQSEKRPIMLRLYGHRGLKPYQLQNKMIRLIHLASVKPYVRPGHADPNAEDTLTECGEDEETQSETHEDGEEEEKDANLDAAAHESEDKDDGEKDEDTQHTVAAEDGEAEAKDDNAPGAPETSAGEKADDGASKEEEEEQSVPCGDNAAESAEGVKQDESKPSEAVDQSGSESTERGAVPANKSGEQKNIDEQPFTEPQTAPALEAVMENPAENDVVPLTVEGSISGNYYHGSPHNESTSLATCPVLTTKHLEALKEYFHRELKYLWTLEDVRLQRISITFNLGTAYCCLSQGGASSQPLMQATFGEFIEKLNQEAVQIYFLKDSPVCVSRAVDSLCRSHTYLTSYSIVKINFFSNDKQSRMTARALWDGHENRFKLLDMENPGVSFNWTVFSVDKYGDEEKENEEEETLPSEAGHGHQNEESCDGGEPPAAAAQPKKKRKKTVAFPFEVEFRAFRRWKQHTVHPAAPLADEILERLSEVEHNMMHHGSSIVYEMIDLEHLCNIDAASEDFNVESIIIEHTEQCKTNDGGNLFVESTNSLWIENFSAARAFIQMRNSGAQNHSAGRGRGRGMSLSLMRELGLNSNGRSRRRGGPDYADATMSPASKLTLFRSRGATVHWKLQPGKEVEENLAPLPAAIDFVHRVLHDANQIEDSARGGGAPQAL